MSQFKERETRFQLTGFVGGHFIIIFGALFVALGLWFTRGLAV